MAESSPAVAPPPGNPRFPLLDAMRGIAALSILVTHASGVSNFNTDNVLGAYTARLNFGVTMFFLLSGFLLYRPFVAARREGRPKIATGRFLRRRLLRIVPAYWVALTVLTIYPGLLGTVHIPPNGAPTTIAPIARSADGQLAPAPTTSKALQPTTIRVHGAVIEEHTWRFYTFTQIYSPDTIVQGIGPAWTLCIEMSFYLLLPFLAMAIGWRRPSVRGELLLLAALALACIGLRTALQAGGGFTVWQNTLACYIDWFAYGMMLAVLSVAWHGREQQSRALRLISRRPWAPWAVAAVAYWFMATQLDLSRGFFIFYTQFNYFAEHAMYPLCAVLLLLPAIFGDADGGWPRRLLGNRWLHRLGLISYGIFLYHSPLMLEINRLGGEGWIPGSGLISLVVCTFTAAAIYATLSYRFVELPALRFKDPRAPRTPASAPVLRAEEEARTAL